MSSPMEKKNEKKVTTIPPHPKQVLTIAQVAEEFHLSEYQQKHLRDHRQLRYFRFGKGEKLIGYFRKEVDRYFEEQAKQYG